MYQFTLFSKARDDGEHHWPTLIGVKEATTFTGFCGRHDAEVFSAIENAAFRNSAEERFLYHYRAFAQDYYTRAHRFRPLESAAKEMESKLSAEDFAQLAKDVVTNRLDLDELTAQKKAWDAELLAKQWSVVDGCAFIGCAVPQIFGTQYFAPRKDFEGRIIQNTKQSAALDWVSLTITTVENQALFLMCGRKCSQALGALVASFRKLAPTDRTKAIVAYIFCLFENFIIMPAWWESLSKGEQLHYVNAFEARYFPRALPISVDWKLEEMPTAS